MPRHRVVAGGDGHASAFLKTLGGLRDAQAGAGDENRVDRGRCGKTLCRGFYRGDRDTSRVAVVAPVESRDGTNVETTVAEISDQA